MKRLSANWWEAITLILILGLAGWLRFRGIDWGNNYYYHPDESFMTQVVTGLKWPSSVGQYFDTAASPLNPYTNGYESFVYGTFPLFVAKLIGTLTNNELIGNAHLAGRWMSAGASLIGVFLLWWIGRQMFGRLTGLLAALLLSVTMLDIQTAHYFTTDAMCAMLATAAFAFAYKAYRSPNFLWYALAGLAVGLATASKPNLLVTGGFLALPALELIRVHGFDALIPRAPFASNPDDEDGPHFPVFFATILAGFIAIWSFRIAMPYAFAGPTLFNFSLNPDWQSALDFWRRAQAGEIDMPPSIQWTDRTPILFILDNLIQWGMGPGLAIPSLAGLGILLWQFIRSRTWPSWWYLGIAGFILFHILFYGTGMSKTQRYLLPVYPLLILLGAATLVVILRWGWEKARSQNATLRLPAFGYPVLVIATLAVVSTILYGIAFSSIYSRPITRTEASNWIYDNVPQGSTLATEYWDYGLPVSMPIPDHQADRYNFVELKLYDTDNDEKVGQLIANLNQTDYIVITSNRLWLSIPRMPDRYPATIAYYNALFSGQLGFDRVASFTSPPQLFGVEIDDRAAEESLTVYEHPEVLIFKKSDRFDAQTVSNILNTAMTEPGVVLFPVNTQPYQSMLTPDEQQTVNQHSTWSDMFRAGLNSGFMPYLLWYLALQVIVLPMVAILWRAFPNLPDRGYALAKTFGLFGVAWLAWLLVALDWAVFGPIPILTAWLGLAAIGIALTSQHLPDLRTFARASWRWIAVTEGLFLGIFVMAAWFRNANPVPWFNPNTESQWSTLTTFNAVLRTPIFPPPDPGYSGGVMHDAYLGVLPSAVLARLTGIPPEMAARLALATTLALIGLNAWIAAGILQRSLVGRTSPRSIVLAAPILVCFLGSMDFARRIGADTWGLISTGNLMDIARGIPEALFNRPSITSEQWLNAGQIQPGVVEHFPFRSLISGDLASASLALPLVVATLALAIHIAQEIARRPPTDIPLGTFGDWRGAVTPMLFIGIATGVVFGSGFYQGAILFGIVMTCLALAIAVQAEWDLAWPQLRDAGLIGLGLAIICGFAIGPFLNRFGVISRKTLPLETTFKLDDWLTVVGIPLVLIAGYLLILGWQSTANVSGSGQLLPSSSQAHNTKSCHPEQREGQTLVFPARIAQAQRAWTGHMEQATPLHMGQIGTIILAGIFGTALLGALWLNSLPAFLLVLTTATAVIVWLYQHHIAPLVIAGVLAVVWSASLLAQRLQFELPSGGATFATASADLTWLIMGIVAVAILDKLDEQIAGSGSWRVRLVAQPVAWIATSLALIGIVASSIFPVYAIGARMNDWADAPLVGQVGDFIAPTEADRQAARWLQENVAGYPVLLESPGVAGWEGRISALTGFPTVTGNVNAEIDQRIGLEPRIRQRQDDVNEIYGRVVPFSVVEPLVQHYGVSLIYVGPAERIRIDPLALQKFDDAVATGQLTIIYQNDQVTIYQYTAPQ